MSQLSLNSIANHITTESEMYRGMTSRMYRQSATIKTSHSKRHSGYTDCVLVENRHGAMDIVERSCEVKSVRYNKVKKTYTGTVVRNGKKVAVQAVSNTVLDVFIVR
jgi:mannose/fructose/N-acetylgalactosamine-specific phosphotransferase system component IIB